MSLWASWRRKRRGWRRSTDEISKPPCGNSLNSNPKSQAPKKFQTEKTAKLITRVQKKGIGNLKQFLQLARKHALRAAKEDLGKLVTLEAAKIVAEGQGEVQEMIDICDFAVGLSRQLYGLTIASERPEHRMMEQWHPLGLVGIITAFNFPVAVWSWNSALAAVCGDATIWKPSTQTPLTAIATIKIAERICAANSIDPAIFSLVIGDSPTIGERLSNDYRVALISATGSTRMARCVSV